MARRVGSKRPCGRLDGRGYAVAQVGRRLYRVLSGLHGCEYHPSKLARLWLVSGYCNKHGVRSGRGQRCLPTTDLAILWT